MVQKSKRYRAAAAKIDHNKKYDLGEAVKLLKECGGTKFDQTVNIAIKLGIDPKQSDQTIRGSVSLPKGTGKTLRVVAFCQGPDIEAAKAAGAIAAGVDDLVEKVQGGWLDFDVAVGDRLRGTARAAGDHGQPHQCRLGENDAVALDLEPRPA